MHEASRCFCLQYVRFERNVDIFVVFYSNAFVQLFLYEVILGGFFPHQQLVFSTDGFLLC